jgi:hypothetical protein
VAFIYYYYFHNTKDAGREIITIGVKVNNNKTIDCLTR